MNIQQKIIQILADYSKQDNINLNLCLSNLNLDSLDYVEISFDIQDQFGIDISENNWVKIKTVKNLVDLIESGTKS